MTAGYVRSDVLVLPRQLGYPFKAEAQTALFKDAVRTAM